MRKIAILVCALAICSTTFSAFAQVERDPVKEFNKGKNNWFISVGGAATVLQAEQDKFVSIGDRLKFSGELSVGKWFNPYVGTRLQVMGGSLKGANFWKNQGDEILDRYIQKDRSRTPFPIGYTGINDKAHVGDWSNPANWSKLKTFKNFHDGLPGFWQEFNYEGVAIDLMGNLSNLFRGYWGNEHAVDIIPYFGLGVAHAEASLTNPSHFSFLGRVGFRTDFNLNSKWAVFLEPQVNWVSSEFDGYEGNRVCDMFGNLYVGIQFNINRDFYTPATLLSQDEINYINDRINENRGLIANQQTILERQQALMDKMDGRVTKLENNRPVTAANNSDYRFLPEYIRFTLDSYQIPSSEQSKIEDAMAFLKANPDSKLLLIGYADKKTGKGPHNLTLSRNRVESVAAELKRRGINPNRLILEWKGDKEQPFTQNDWNRVVILVERK